MKDFNRRAFLVCGLLGTQSMLAACGGGGEETAARSTEQPAPTTTGTPVTPVTPVVPVSPAQPQWDIGRALYFLANGQSSFDLGTTLPGGVAKGGTFGVDSSGAALPAGLTLSASGVLQAATGAALGNFSGVVFVYNEP